MSMHRKTDSEGTTSLAPSSPNRPYYVQSPSRDSHDGEKTTNSFQSTPVLSPMGSPGRHSRESSSTRFSGSLKPGSQKSTNNKTRLYPQRKGDNNNNNNKDWKEFDAIEEEGLLDDEVARRGLRRRRLYLLAFFVGFVLLFTFFSLVLWGASRNQKPLVTMKSISFDQFVIQAGSDASGVATDMVSVNSTMQLIFRNKGTFFGVHVTSSPMDLSYTELTLATGEINKFYQSRKSQRTVSIPLIGNRIPLYGGGSNLVNKAGKPSTPVPLTLNFTVKATAYVLGKLVKTKFSKDIGCSLVLDPLKMNTAVSLKNSCTYH